MTLSYKGMRACKHQVRELPYVEKVAKKHGVTLRYYQLIGGAPQSGGTHFYGGCTDVQTLSKRELIGDISDLAVFPNDRYMWQGFAMLHDHMVHMTCDCGPDNSGKDYQQRALRGGRDGLTANRPDLWSSVRPGGKANLTHAAALAMFNKAIGQQAQASSKVTGASIVVGGKRRRKLNTMSARNIDRSRRFGWFSVDALWAQVGLDQMGLYHAVIDGKWGKVSDAAYAKYRKQRGWKPLKKVTPNFVKSLLLHTNSPIKPAAK